MNLIYYEDTSRDENNFSTGDKITKCEKDVCFCFRLQWRNYAEVSYTKMIFENPHWKILLSKGIKNMDDKDDNEKTKLLLQHLDDMLYKNYNKRMSDYGFPESEKEFSELSHVVGVIR